MLPTSSFLPMMNNNHVISNNASTTSFTENSNRVNIGSNMNFTAGPIDYSSKPLKIPPKKTNAQRKPFFAEELMKVLNSAMDVQSILYWLPSGNSFCIANQSRFVEEVLSKYFRGTKYGSFLRRLKRWGFQRIGTIDAKASQAGSTQAQVYACELFQRDKPEMCKFMCDERRLKRRKEASRILDEGSRLLNEKKSTREPKY